MDSIVLYNQNGQKFDVNVVRYFEKGNNKYLVFDLAEVDRNGYIQLYLAKVNEKDGKIVMENVTNEDEWNDFRNTIQKIVSNNKNGIANDSDLDYKELDGATVSEFRIFKLKEEVAKSLGENKNAKREVETSKPEPINLQSASAQETGLTIEEILKKVSDGAKSARENTKIDLNVPKKTLEDIMEPEEKEITLPSIEEEIVVPPVHEELKENPRFIIPVEDRLEPKVIPSMNVPEVSISNETDYKAKYEESLETVRKLENENMRLINELVEAKAKLATIKDVIE